MDRNTLIACFQDTQQRAVSNKLRDCTQLAILSSKVYKEGYVSGRPHSNYDILRPYTAPHTTFAEAKRYVGKGRIAVLNFANPETPGGGVQNGAMAQEECLCRSSNLYPCLTVPNVQKEYYEYHRRKANHFFSDRLIYTKDVTVFKSDDPIPQLLPEEEWFTVDVITCAAPYIAKRKHTNLPALKNLFISRIKNIFEVAVENQVDFLILGAFGCGAFKNPPEVVASAFDAVIFSEMYRCAFKEIAFAIKPTKVPEMQCPNFKTFYVEFMRLPVNEGEEVVEIPGLISPTGVTIPPIKYINHINGNISCSVNLCLSAVKESIGRGYNSPEYSNQNTESIAVDFLKWQINNLYYKKQFSILGDSVSTLEGYNPRGYALFYYGEKCERTQVREYKDTWWGKVIDFLGGELLVNNSWSGSRVTKLPDKDKLFPSGCSDERTSSLHINEVTPDVIFVNLGTNDWARGVTPCVADHILGKDDYTDVFEDAYGLMLSKLRANYPNAEICCCTLSNTFISEKPKWEFPSQYGGVHIDTFNEIIRHEAASHGCRLIDLAMYGWPYDSVDGSHPNAAGMNTIATMIIRELAGDEVFPFLDCQDGGHDYRIVEEYTGGRKYVCKKCGRIHYTNILHSPEGYPFTDRMQLQANSQKEGVMGTDNVSEVNIEQQNGDTTVLPNNIRITVKSTGDVKIFAQPVIKVGRGEKYCDLVIAGKPGISRVHATFAQIGNAWFVTDNNSINGIWLNGKKIEPGTQHKLHGNDQIDLAHQEMLMFYQTGIKQVDKATEEQQHINMLLTGMTAFAESGHKDELSLKVILLSLSKAPLYMPVSIDLEAMFENLDPGTLRAGDVINPSKDVRMKVLTVSNDNGQEFIPLFTSGEIVNKVMSNSIVRYYPSDYVPMLVQMGKPAVVNPYTDTHFILSQELIQNVLVPLVNDPPEQTTSENDNAVQPQMIGEEIEGKYRITKLLSGGGQFEMYLALNIHTGQTVAIKAYDKKGKGFDAQFFKLVIQEANMMRAINHPCALRVYDLIENERFLFMVMEKFEGKTLSTISDEYGALSEEQVVSWAKDICEGLEYLHTMNPPRIHRDIKPQNILLTTDGKIKIIDFCLMKCYDPNEKEDAFAVGTVGYAPPEQYSGHTDARTDIFALGMTMHQLVTGMVPPRPPFEAKPIRQINPALSQKLEKIIAKCIEKEPSKRYQSCNELLIALSSKKQSFFGKLFGKA